MAIYRMTERKRYVNVNMDILTSKDLTATEKVVLIFALSRPDDWKFSIRGIAYYMHEGPDAVRTAVQGLEEKGYFVRTRKRNNGKFAEMEYDVYEVPDPTRKKSTQDSPPLEPPAPGQPSPEKPMPDSQSIPITDADNIDVHNIDIPNMENTDSLSVSYPSIYPKSVDEIKKQIQYDILCEAFDKRILADIVSVMVEVMVSQSSNTVVSRDKAFPTDYVRKCLSKINSLHIEQILRSMERDQPVIRNIRGYLLAALINAANTMDTGYEFGAYE